MARPLVLRLYIAGSTPNSRRALNNLAPILAEATATWQLDVVDVVEDPLRALADGIMLTPQLLILSEGGARSVIGDLSDRAVVLSALGTDSGVSV